MCTAMGDWIKILKICLHRAEQRVWFEGEAVGGTCKEGVVGWGCSRCRSQRLKLAKFLFGQNLKKPVRDYLNNQPIASLQNRGGAIEGVTLKSLPKLCEESIKIGGVRAIFRLVNFWCGFI